MKKKKEFNIEKIEFSMQPVKLNFLRILIFIKFKLLDNWNIKNINFIISKCAQLNMLKYWLSRGL